MKNALRSAGWVIALYGLGACASAQVPVALVEELRGQVAGLEFMDYVAAGRVIELGPGDRLVLGYLQSCWRETITGGTITVGTEHSVVQQGRVERSLVACGAGRKPADTRDATPGAAMVYRSMPAIGTQAARPRVHGLSPVVEVGAGRGRLLIERLDTPDQRIEVSVAGAALLRGRFLDLARTDVALVPGAAYAISLGAQRLEFQVDAQALPGATPIVGRLLRLP